MENELLKCLVNFYSKLESVDKKWNEVSIRTEKIIRALKNQVEQLRHVTSPEVDNAEICLIPGLRDQLIFKILAGIEEEIVLIQESIYQFNNLAQDLRHRLINVETIRSKCSLENDNMKELVNGTTRRPKLNLLLEWAIDACDYYQKLYYQINQGFKALNYKDEETVEKLGELFVENETTRMKIDRILAYTQFIAAEAS